MARGGRWKSIASAGTFLLRPSPFPSHAFCRVLTWWVTHRDAFTSSGDFIISPHSAAKGLYVATCGNFHGWKFFPVLGKYVVQMLEGELAPQLMQKWAWDRERPDPAGFADYPRFEMKDLAGNDKPGEWKLRAKL
jgi:hypothetical protein